jgi:hypothetical protein
VNIPDTPSAEQVKDAANLLLAPWVDFSFVSPVESLDAELSRSAAVYATMIAANRRALEIAPGIGFTSHGEGMSSGKTLAGEIVGAIATGDIPTPVSLSTNFTEQRKEIITFFVEGDGSLFLDNIQPGTRFDAASLASSMTSTRFKGRLLGTNKQIEVSTRAMVIATGISLNMAGDLASRFLLVRLDTELERPEDRSVGTFKIPYLRRWVVEHRQQLVAAVHTIVRAYLQECRRCGGTPADVVARRQVGGTRFGGPCEILRDAFLWAFQDLPDPFLSFQASALNSSTKAEAELVLRVLDRIMAQRGGRGCAPAWAALPTGSPEEERWRKKFRARWGRMTPDQRRHRYQTTDLNTAENLRWRRLQERVQATFGRRELRTGHIRFTSSEILQELQSAPDDQALVDGAMHGKGLNPVVLGRWLKDRLVDAPIGGLKLRSAQREHRTHFWITAV